MPSAASNREGSCSPFTRGFSPPLTPIEEIRPVTSLVPVDSTVDIRIARELGRRDRNAKLPSLINALASEFGVSRRFMEVRLLRYGLIEEAQLVTD